MAQVKLQNIDKYYSGERIIKSLSFVINHGEFVALVGPSGCGKTTTLKVLAGLIKPEHGEILLDGVDITSIPAEKRDIVMVFQDHLLFPHLSVGENIAFGLKMLGIPRKVREDKVRVLLEMVQLPGIEKRYPAQLSGGQQQRVALARALALEPKVLLLDEPLSNLDPGLRDGMRELISRLHKELNMTTLFVTHDQDEAMLLADKIAVMLGGELVQYDTPFNLYNKPISREVANMFGICNYMQGFLYNGVFHVQGKKYFVPHLTIQGNVEAYIRAEHIDLVSSQRGCLLGVVRERKFICGHSMFKVDTESGDVTALVKNHLDVSPGSRVNLKIDWERVWFQSRGDGSEGLCDNSHIERSSKYKHHAGDGQAACG
ncbi:MAG: ABC transporter ATP-binding protein [Bacillota bacterium]